MVNNLYLIKPQPEFDTQIGILISMLNYTRYTTLQTVSNLTTTQLDFLLDQNSNSIGALLMHIAAVEYYYRINTFENREFTEQEQDKWNIALSLGNKARSNINKNELSFYLNILENERNITIQCFKNIKDNWLYHQEKWDNEPVNNYFKWFHVMEDELNHRGQMRIIRKKLSNIN